MKWKTDQLLQCPVREKGILLKNIGLTPGLFRKFVHYVSRLTEEQYIVFVLFSYRALTDAKIAEMLISIGYFVLGLQ